VAWAELSDTSPARARHGLEVAEESDQDDDRNGDADKPEQHGAHRVFLPEIYEKLKI
jgi:hypothetical protein